MIRTFCDPLLEGRYDCHLRPADIDSALKFFGPGLVKLFINPMYLEGKTKINYTFPEDLEVEGHAGVAGWELMGEIKEGTKIPVDKNPAAEIPQNTAWKQQGEKPAIDKDLGGRKTPAEKNKPPDLHPSAW